ncbi:MAG: SDR family oxidoreductase [Candidatus Rokubacteria bacterium]|nr:SDR family oxidoreductase [Candidatus Rokubacteria bacterium]
MSVTRQRALLIGGAGYLGAVLTRRLLAEGWGVTVYDALLFGPEPMKELEGDPGFCLIRGDVRDLSGLAAAIPGHDAVIVLAALVGEPACQKDARGAVEVNYLSAILAAQAARYCGISRFVFASTDSCYGAQEGILTESSPLRPISHYARLKMQAEQEILSLADATFSPVVLRMATLYGLSPRMRFDLIVNTLTMHAVTRRRIRIYGGEQWRPLVHVADAAEAYVLALQAARERIHGEIINVGSDEQNYQIGEIGRVVAGHFPGISVEVLPQAPDLRDYHVSFAKAAAVLGFRAMRGVTDGIREIARALTSGEILDPDDGRYVNA